VDPEQQQVARAASGDEVAFQVVWSSHRDTVYRFACWVLQDAAAAEDVVQECFMALLEHPARFDPARASLRAFLLGIARNQCRNRWRRLRSEVELEEKSMGYDPRTLDCLALDEANAILNAAVGNLPPLQREALFLFEYEGLGLEDAASIARVGVGTFKARLHRGRERLKRELAWLVKEGF
jgi:RNA polymerase sigma-70 factor (ECF subfamily)